MQAAGDPPLNPASTDGDAARPTDGQRRSLVGLLVGLALVWAALDQVSKALVTAHLRHGRVVRLLGGHLLLVQVRNSGAAFGIGTGSTVVFTVVAAAVVVVIVRTARRLRSTAWAVALGLLLGGAGGNLIDRLARSPGVFRGAVVDWIDLRWWPVFNLADSGIVLGGLLAVLLALRGIGVDGSRGR